MPDGELVYSSICLVVYVCKILYKILVSATKNLFINP
jgi:hypothetical protein